MSRSIAAFVALTGVQGSVLYNSETHIASKSSGCGKSSVYTAGRTTVAKGTYDGVTYTYRVYVPKNYNKNTAIPLVSQLHGWGLTAKSEEQGSGITIYAEKYGFIAVYPQGSDDNAHYGSWYSWNAVGSTESPGPVQPTCTSRASDQNNCYTSCGKCSDNPQCWWTTCNNELTKTGSGTSGVNGFLPSLYDTLESQLCIDTSREFAAGESNGGMMTYQMGVSMAPRLAAVVPEFGSFHFQFAESPSTGVPILEFHGNKDTTVPGNVSLSGDGFYYTTTHDIFHGGDYSSGWMKSNGCSGSSSHYPTSYDGEYDLYCVSAGSCSGGDVVRCAWTGGHNWYGNNPRSNGGLVSEFLMKWTKPTHLGFGRVDGEEPREGELLEDIEILEDDEEPNRFADLPKTVLSVTNGHYGNPSTGCQDDEDVIELAQGVACMPTISSKVEAGGRVPNCKIGGSSPVADNACPNDAAVPADSKAFPICLGKGNTIDPYTNGEFHCVLVCPCTVTPDGVCDDDSHYHCPADSTCQLGELRHRGQGVCSYSPLSSVNV